MSAWSGPQTNGFKAAKTQAKPKSKEEDVESYFKINEVKRLVNVAVNSVAAERPADFRKALCSALNKPDLLTSASNKKATKEEAEKAKEYLTAHQADSLLADVLSQLAVAMPANPAAELATYIANAPPPKPLPAAKPKEEKPKAEKAKPATPAKADPPAAKAEPAAKSPAKEAAKSPEKPSQPKPAESKMDPKALKNAIKEGGKKGVELAGNFDLGGPKFFTTQMASAEGQLDLLQACMDAANKEVDPSEEEAKGGSGMVAKLIWSCTPDNAAGPKQIAVINYVPESLAAECNAEEWMKAALKECGGGEILKAGPHACTAVVKEDPAAGRFTLKDKDTIQAISVQWLISKGLFESKEEDDWVPDDDAGIELLRIIKDLGRGIIIVV